MLKAFRTQFNAAGHVPFREKDKIHEAFNAAMDIQFDRLKVANSERRLQNFQSSVKDTNNGEKSKTRLLGERDKLLRQHERLRNDIQTYENNMGFLSVSSKSKSGNGLVKDMQRRIDDLKAELDLLEKKINLLDEGLGF
jgi:predicted RNase H-like nuclease (RuvC/YqgF family)